MLFRSKTTKMGAGRVLSTASKRSRTTTRYAKEMFPINFMRYCSFMDIVKDTTSACFEQTIFVGYSTGPQVRKVQYYNEIITTATANNHDCSHFTN